MINYVPRKVLAGYCIVALAIIFSCTESEVGQMLQPGLGFSNLLLNKTHRQDVSPTQRDNLADKGIYLSFNQFRVTER